MRKPAFCICENKDADQLRGYDQLRGNREANQRQFVFAIRIVQSLYYLYPKFQASSHLLWLYRSSVAVQLQKTGFLKTRLKYHPDIYRWGGLTQWLASRTTDQGVPGSRSGRGTVCRSLEQVTFTYCLVLVKPRKPWMDD